MKEFTSYLIGNISIAMFCALYFFALVGVTINLLMHANSRNQKSYNTPVNFSVKFLMWDNWKRIVLAVLLIYISIRFVTKIVTINVDDNSELYLFMAVIIGFCYDKLLQLWKEKSSILKVRKQ